ncbi:hypothetical protein ACWIID_02420 [Streptomyces phaeochromogenes]
MTTHKLQIQPTYARTVDGHGRPGQLPLGKVTTCSCGLATGSVPGGIAERVYKQHRASISLGQEPAA